MMLLFSLLFIVIKAMSLVILDRIGAIIPFIYAAWAIGQFYDKFKIISYVKAAIAYFLGIIIFAASIPLIGTLIDMIIKH
jgi:hypothetical protein